MDVEMKVVARPTTQSRGQKIHPRADVTALLKTLTGGEAVAVTFTKTYGLRRLLSIYRSAALRKKARVRYTLTEDRDVGTFWLEPKDLGSTEP